MVMYDVVFVKELVLGPIPVGSQGSSAKTGTLGMSGAVLVVYDGTGWKQVTVT